MSRQLQELRSGINEEVDIPGFMTLTVTEAKRVGLQVQSIRPESAIKHEFFSELPFSFQFRGVYLQLIVFLQRLANTQNIIRVDSFDLKPIAESASKYVELAGTVQIKTFKYLGTKADQVGIQTLEAAKGGVAPVSPKDAASSLSPPIEMKSSPKGMTR